MYIAAMRMDIAANFLESNLLKKKMHHVQPHFICLRNSNSKILY